MGVINARCRVCICDAIVASAQWWHEICKKVDVIEVRIVKKKIRPWLRPLGGLAPPQTPLLTWGASPPRPPDLTARETGHNSGSRRPFETLTSAFYTIFQN